MGAFFPIIFYMGILLSQPYKAAGITAFESSSDPMNIVIMAVVLIIGTATILFFPQKLKDKEVLRAIFIGLCAYSVREVVYILIFPYLPVLYPMFVSTLFMGATVVLLLQKPEWYVIDIIAIFLGAGATASIGMSFSVPLSIILLVGMIIYDAFAVYKTKHMIGLAESVIRMRLPVIMIVPESLPYTWLTNNSLVGSKAHFMGLGDLVFPGMLVVSAHSNIQNPLVTFSIVLGTMVGFVGVSYLVSKGKPQAGLPFLCTGAILGFVVSSMIIYGRLML